jgi:hypothetical protein
MLSSVVILVVVVLNVVVLGVVAAFSWLRNFKPIFYDYFLLFGGFILKNNAVSQFFHKILLSLAID